MEMEAVLVGLSVLGLVVLVSTWGLWWLLPKRREQLARSAWFAFAPLVFGLIGLLAIALVVLFGNADTVSPALASSGTITLFNIYNGYRSAEAYLKQRHKH